MYARRFTVQERLGQQVADHFNAMMQPHGRGFDRILTEGGPRLMGAMLEASVVDELSLTISPKLIGGGPDRPPLTNGAEGLGLDSAAELLSARRARDYLFLRYAIAAGSAA